ncbi:hypothetical protein SLS62_005198 [Diatrype stigma]|uniref:Mannan endo-1,6-alpha-mannosidase n=1 Tax=Diatrype stigma TaxID=117547 RepID=A0AAN9YPW8_9PEZI
MKEQYRLLAWAALASLGTALQLDINDETSIAAAAGEIAKGIYVYHNIDSPDGQFNQPEAWFWWLSGSGWTGLIDYTVYTNDTTYQADILTALSKNVGPNFDFIPPEQASSEANDDQMYWVYAALTALEYDFEALPCEPSEGGAAGDCTNSWLAIGTNAWEGYVDRWNKASDTCGGGLKWQWNTAASGYYYKNAVTNGGFFQISARLARYTGNQTYADWATRIWDWSTRVGLVSDDFHVYDGTSDNGDDNCTAVSHDEWSYNLASYLNGAANMFAFTGGDQVWEDRVKGFVDTAATTFFTSDPNPAGIMYEQKCETDTGCTTDQTSFKASLSRWLGKTAVLVPSVQEKILGLLETSAAGAAASCSGNGNSTCGVQWFKGDFDGQSDFGTELSALEVVQSLLVIAAPKPAVASP